MGHKADKSFFERKRAWSKRKDTILAYYLDAYLAKVRRLKRPVLLVDGFAGPGKFADGEAGSPMIICAKAKTANEKPGPAVRVLCIEAEPELFEKLRLNVAFPFAEARRGEFLDYVAEIRERAQTHTIFLYVDPYTAADINWTALDSISEQIHRTRASVELLMNFNTPSFVRWGLSALKRAVPVADEGLEDPEETDSVLEPPDQANLTRVVGGDWWREVISAPGPFAEVVEDVATRIGAALHRRYAEVCWVPVKGRRDDRVPKYHMFFGSRHPDALELMNNAMVKARGASDFQIDLFAEDDVDRMVVSLAPNWVARRELILRVIRRVFCRYYWKDIRARVESLLERGLLVSETGKVRINDNVRVKRS